jgi:uncharacterized membrane protein
MAKSAKHIVINAPVEKIFAYMNDPDNLLSIYPSMLEVKDVQLLPNGGASFKFVYKVAGIHMEGFSEDTEFELNQRTVSKVSGGFEGWVTLVYEAAGQGTKVTLESGYLFPVPLVGKLAETVLIKLNEQENEAVLANLKVRMET